MNKSPKISKALPFTTKSAQIPRREKSKFLKEISSSRSKLNKEKNNKKNEMKRNSSNLENKSFLSILN